MIECGLSNHTHPSIPSIYFEVINRYPTFFEKRTEYIPPVLQSFLDGRGLFHCVKSIRVRCQYLFLRFVKALRFFMGGYVEGILAALQVFSFSMRCV